ncbi:hypothetical protein BSL78_03491 [Apostichopus japonicus]|uniref:C-type lectin domain-containing protein n=1 Tax=Stichopus japonicus TaxID=307972 RepID=A0A2G8LH46_STIJA|nr:hypothetical protein BSL78_03491 [Apostichopus japonicus]
MYGEKNVYTLPLSSLCPEDYIVGYDYGCYQFNSEHMTWEAARAHCRQAVDGDLAIIDEEAEMIPSGEPTFGAIRLVDW